MSRRDLAVVPDLERELEDLYGRPLGDFTAARNDLSKRLKKAGQTDEAARVGGLSKPSISAWAVNQLPRREPDRVAELLRAGTDLVEAQKAALAGRGAEGFDDASRGQRDAIRKLVSVAAAALEEAGHRPSDAVRERIASSLRAASVDPEGRKLLEAGRLEEDFQSAGLGLLAGIAPTTAAAPASARAGTKARLREARAAVERARAERRRAEAAAEDAARGADAARAEADRAAERAQALAAEAAAAERAFEEAEAALRELGEA